jgi:hypothetical protein
LHDQLRTEWLLAEKRDRVLVKVARSLDKLIARIPDEYGVPSPKFRQTTASTKAIFL